MFSYSSVIPSWLLFHCEAVYVRKINLLPATLARDCGGTISFLCLSCQDLVRTSWAVLNMISTLVGSLVVRSSLWSCNN